MKYLSKIIKEYDVREYNARVFDFEKIQASDLDSFLEVYDNDDNLF